MKTVQELQEIRWGISNKWFENVSDGGAVQNHPDGNTPNHIITESLQEYLGLVKEARQQGSIVEQYDEPWGRRLGFQRSDGKIISIHIQIMKNYPFQVSKNGIIDNIGITIGEASKEGISIVLNKWFCDMEFDVISAMKTPSGRRVVLGLDAKEDEEEVVIDVDVNGKLPCPEGYQRMQDVAHYNDSNPPVHYEYLEVESLDSQFPEKTQAVPCEKIPMITKIKQFDVTFNPPRK